MPIERAGGKGKTKNHNRTKGVRYRAARSGAIRTHPKVRTAAVERKKDANVKRSSHGKYETVTVLKQHEAKVLAAKPKR